MASHLLFRSPSGEVVRVKIGFSWQAFFIGSLRAVIKRLWLIFGVVAIGYVFFAWIGSSLAASSRNTAVALAVLGLYFAYMLFCGIYGNRWLVTSLLRRGFRQTSEDKR
jgi:hypothetical protein